MGLLGERVRRVEDRALLTGAARFTGDLHAGAEPVLVAHFVRSPLAHADVRGIDTTIAAGARGVVRVLTGADLDVRGTTVLPVPADLVRPLMATEVVRFPGEILAMVVATSEAEAIDAAELVEIDLVARPVAADAPAAARPGAPVLHAGHPGNAVLTIDAPPEAADAAAAVFAAAPLVVELDMINQRVAAAPMETNGVLARPVPGGIEVHVSTQAPHGVRDEIAQLCGLDPTAVRVIATWVGGGFGGKAIAEAEYTLVTKAARLLDRPVRWKETRTENLQGIHGRDQHQTIRVAADLDGTLLAVHGDLLVDGGAYPGFAHFLATLTARMLPGPYRVAHATSTIRTMATNSACVRGYRGAGRPEATSLLERAVDVVARALALDPATVRRHNLVPATAFPHTTPTGAVYDAADYGRALDLALAAARIDERRAEQAERRARGDRLQLGIGLCTYVEVTAGAGPTEFADVEVHPDGHATVRVGTFGHGQGHHTTYAQIASDGLGLPLDAIRVIDGDTALVARGVGTFGSRSMQVGGSSVHAASALVAARTRRLAAALLEAAPDDLVGDADGFSVAGVPSRLATWPAIVALAAAQAPEDGADRPGLVARTDWERPGSTYPSGAHVAVVEVDTETGQVRLLEHVAVDDCGTLLNPMLVDGQVHGGIAQGVGQALFEALERDEHGTVRNASLAEYAVVSAAELPSFTRVECVTPTPLNPLGAKGIGESGTIGATPAVHNAVIDALTPYGVLHLDMPCSPERVWRAIHGEHPEVRVTRR